MSLQLLASAGPLGIPPRAGLWGPDHDRHTEAEGDDESSDGSAGPVHSCST